MVTHFRPGLGWKCPLGQIFLRFNTSTSAKIQKLGLLKTNVSFFSDSCILSSFWNNQFKSLRKIGMNELNSYNCLCCCWALNASNEKFVMVLIFWLVYCVKGKELFSSQHLQQHAGLWLAERNLFSKPGTPLVWLSRQRVLFQSSSHTVLPRAVL